MSSIANPTVNFQNDWPAPPANGINVEWQSATSVHNSGQLNVSAAVVGDGNTSHFLRGDGTFAPQAASSGDPVGSNFSPPIFQKQVGANGTGWAGVSSIMRLSASQVPCFGTALTLTLTVGSGTVKVAKAVCLQVTPGTSTIVNSYQFLWSGNGAPTLVSGDNTSDSLAVTTDTAHDWYIIIHWDSTTTGNISSYDAATAGWEYVQGCFGYLSGDYTANPPNGSLNGYNVGITQVVLA